MRFPGFKVDWEIRKLGDIGEIVNGLTYNPTDVNQNGILVLRSSNVQNRTITFNDNVHVNCKTYNPVKENDILICVRNGSRNLIGKNALIKKEHEGLAFGAFMTVYRSPFNKFLFQWFDTLEYKEIVNKNLGATINSINGSDLKKFEVPFPEVKEQNKISQFLSLIDERIQTQKKIIEQLESLIKALGQAMFNHDRFKFKHFKLGEICEIKKGEQINGSELTEFGQYPVINGGTTPSGYHSKYNCNADTITISEGGNSCGYVQFNKGPFWSGGHCYSLNRVKAVVLNKYLFYYLKFSESKIMSLRVGSGLPNIQKNAISNFEVIVSNEQTQTLITKMLDTIYEKRRYEIVFLNLIDKQKQYLLSSMFK